MPQESRVQEEPTNSTERTHSQAPKIGILAEQVCLESAKGIKERKEGGKAFQARQSLELRIASHGPKNRQNRFLVTVTAW